MTFSILFSRDFCHNYEFIIRKNELKIRKNELINRKNLFIFRKNEKCIENVILGASYENDADLKQLLF